MKKRVNGYGRQKGKGHAILIKKDYVEGEESCIN